MNPLFSVLVGVLVLTDPGAGTIPTMDRRQVRLEQVRELTPEESELMRKGAAAFAAGDVAECLKLLEGVDGASASHPELLNLRGAALSELGRSKEAMAFFEWALERDPGHFWARFNLAECVGLSGDPSRARKLFLVVPSRTPAEQELIALKLLLLDLQLDDEASARRQLPVWPPASAAGYAAYAALAHREGNELHRAAILSESRRLHADEWGIFLKKTLEEAGVPTD